MTGRSPLITLNNGVTMPALGLGVLNRSSPERTADAVDRHDLDVYSRPETILLDGLEGLLIGRFLSLGRKSVALEHSFMILIRL